MDIFYGCVGAFVGTATAAAVARIGLTALVPGLALGWCAQALEAHLPGGDGIESRGGLALVAAMLGSALAGWAFVVLAREPADALEPAAPRPRWRWMSVLAAALLSLSALMPLLTAVLEHDVSSWYDSYHQGAPPDHALGVATCLLLWLVAVRWLPALLALAGTVAVLAGGGAIIVESATGELGPQTLALLGGGVVLLTAATTWARGDARRWRLVALCVLSPVIALGLYGVAPS